MDKTLTAALDYLPRWLEHQVKVGDMPGVSFAVTHKGKPVLAVAFGHAHRGQGLALEPTHRFRVASHSKTFTAAGVMRLREQGRLQLDDPLGHHVGELHPQVAALTLAQLLSHSGGLVRDGADAGQWMERRPFLNAAELRADLAEGPTIEPATRFKYSNHGYGLLGLVIESVTGERYRDWIAREIVAASGLTDTYPDADVPGHDASRLASGHGTKWPLGERPQIPATMSTHDLASATGFVSTASDLARFFHSLSPEARRSVLSVASRREMTRRQWRDPYASVEQWYGLGTMQGTHQGLAGRWDWFGHTGGFPGTLSRTVCLPAQQLALSAITNAADGVARNYVDGAMHLLQAYKTFGAPSRRAAAWTGRWWNLWGVMDLLPMNDRVLVANPTLMNPLQDATEIEPLGRDRKGVDRGRIVQASGYAAFGEGAALERDARGRATVFQLGGARLAPEAAAVREIKARYG